MLLGDEEHGRGLARVIRARALDLESELCVGELALRLLGAESLAYAPDGQTDAWTLHGPAPWRILVRRDLDDDELTDAIADAIASWWYASVSVDATSGMVETLGDALIALAEERPNRSGVHVRFDVA